MNELPKTEITISSEEVKTAIMQSKTNYSAGPDNVNIHHLKHLGTNAITYLTDLYNLALNQNIIPQIWKLAKIIPIPKPNKVLNIGSSYRPISLPSPIAKTLEKIILPKLISNIPNVPTQHGFKAKHYHNCSTQHQQCHHHWLQQEKNHLKEPLQ